MAKKRFKPPHIAARQEFVLEPITDPAELAAHEQRFRESQRRTVDVTFAAVQALCDSLTRTARLEVAMGVVELLELDQRRKLFEWMQSDLPMGEQPKKPPRTRKLSVK